MEIRYEIKNFIKTIEDTRRAEGKRHSLEQLSVIIIMAVLSGHQGVRGIERFVNSNEKELIELLELKHGVPSYQTIQAMLTSLNAQKAAEKFTEWMETYAEELGDEYLSLDGKTLRSTVEGGNTKNQNFIAVVSAFGHKSKMVYGMQSYENKKSAEGEALRALVERLGLKNKVFSVDALHSEKKHLTK